MTDLPMTTFIRILGPTLQPKPYGTAAGLNGWLGEATEGSNSRMVHVPDQNTVHTYYMHNTPTNWVEIEPTEELQARYTAWADKPPLDPKLRRILARITRPSKADVDQVTANEKVKLTQLNPCNVPRLYGRNDKSYPSRQEFEVQGLGYKQRHLASKSDTLTPEELQKLGDLHRISRTLTCWPDHKDVRAVTQEFDLDPFISEHSNLYTDLIQGVVVPNQLRAWVISALNKGYIILYFTALSDLTTCAADSDPVAYISIKVGKRRVLPQQPFEDLQPTKI
jgi:hypothetical protein